MISKSTLQLKVKNYCFIFLLFFYPLLTFAQSVTISYPTSSELVTSCNGSSKLNVRLDIGQASSTDGSVTITLPSGVTYVSGSVTTLTSSGLTIVDNGGTLSAPIFKIAGPLAVGNFINFTILRKGDCTSRIASLSGATFKDNLAATVNGLTVIENNPIINSYVVNFPSISLLQPVAQNNAVLGGIYSRTFTVTNGAIGCANAIHFSIDYLAAGIQQQSLTLAGNPVLPTSIVGNVYNYTIFGNALTADSQFCNGENLVFTETYKVVKCDAVTNYNFGWGCSAVPSQWCQSANGSGTVTMATGTPTFSAHTNTLVGFTNICSPFKVNATYTNGGTGDIAAATMYDVVLRKGSWYNYLYELPTFYKFSNGTINGVAAPSANIPYGTNEIFESNLKNFYTTDPDGVGVGLADIDGDGFYDDLAPGKTVTLQLNMTVICNLVCDQYTSIQAIGGSMLYHTMCSPVIIDVNLNAGGTSLMNV